MTIKLKILQKGNIAFVIIIVLGVIALLVGFVYYTQTQAPETTTLPTATPALKQDESKTTEEDVSFAVQDLLDDIMIDPETIKGELSDVSGGSGSGEAYILRKAGKLWHSVSATLPDPEPETVYEGWLVNKTPSLMFFSTGVMEKQPSGDYMLSFMSDNTYEGYNEVVITLETKVDETPETHILEGIAQ